MNFGILVYLKLSLKIYCLINVECVCTRLTQLYLLVEYKVFST